MNPTSPSILLVDDDKLLLETFRRGFESRGYRVLLAEDGNQALLRLEEASVDVVLLDLLMPEKEGFETLREIKQRYPEQRVYVMSGGGMRNQDNFLQMAVKFGAVSAIRKPVTPSQIIEIIEA